MTASEFVRRGFDLYPEAAHALAAYREELYERLNRALDASLGGKAKFKPVKRTPFEGGSLEEGWYVGYTQSGEVASKRVMLEVGFWWNSPAGAEPIVYGIVHQGAAFDAASCPEGFSHFQWKKRLAVASPFTRDLQVHEALSRIIGLALRKM